MLKNTLKKPTLYRTTVRTPSILRPCLGQETKYTLSCFAGIQTVYWPLQLDKLCSMGLKTSQCVATLD